MSNRSVVVLLIVALSLAVMVLLFEREVGREVEPGPDEYKVFKAYAKDQVHWVNLVRGDLTVQLKRQGDDWQMKLPVRAVAKSKEVEKLLEQLGDLMEVARPIKGRAGEKIDLEQYGLSNPWGKIIVSYGGVKGAELSLGQRTRKHNQLYARLGEENRVMVIDAKAMKLLEEVAADENFYRSRRIFQDRHINKALSIELVWGQVSDGKSIVLGKDQSSGRWLLSSPVKDRADGQAVRKLLDKCAGLRVAEFIGNIDQTTPADQAKLVQMLELYGLTGRGEAGAVAVEAEGMQVVVHLGRADKQGKFRYALVENRAMLAGNRELVKIGAEFAEVLPRSAEALRDRSFLSFQSSAVNEVRISGPEGEIVLGQGRSSEGQATGQWLIRKPLETAADKNIVANFLRELQGLRARNFVGGLTAAMEFEKPYLRIEVQSNEKGKGEILEIGALTANGQARYARLSRDRVVRRVDAVRAEGLVHDSLYFYERKLADVGRREIKSFRFRAAGGQKDEVKGVYKEDQWWLSKPVVMRADSDVVRDVLGILNPLRAERIVADGVAENDTAALGQYGLDEPRYELMVVEEEEVKKESAPEEAAEAIAATQRKEHVLLIGRAVGDEQDEEYYGLLRGREVVFTIRKTAVDKLGGDLRSKKVLPLTNRQIGGLNKVEIIRGDELLSLEKPRENWQVTAPKKFWPSQEAVKRLLESIVGLSGEDFGTKADENQYGLGEPTMTVSLGLNEGSYRFFVGKLLEGKGYAVKTEDEDIVRLVAAEKLEALGQSYLAYRKKEMLSLKKDKVRAIEIIYGKGKRERAEREQLGWKLKVPAGGALELAKLENILGLMRGLRAKEVVADTLEQDRKYGLDKPALTVTIEADGAEDEKIIYSLLIGAEVEDESGSRYARVGGDATVFVVGEKDMQILQEGLLFEPGN